MSTRIPPDVDRHRVDDVAVERFLQGRDVGRDLTRAERELVVRELDRRGLSTNFISLEVGMHVRHVRECLAGGDGG